MSVAPTHTPPPDNGPPTLEWWKAALIVFALILAMITFSGCTSSATRHAITQYEKSDDAMSNAFQNAIRVADEQLYLNFQQFAKTHDNDPSLVLEAFAAVWKARRGLEDIRIQHDRARTLGRMTFGQYLYDQQGFLNVMLEDKLQTLQKAVGASKETTAETGYDLPAELKKALDKASLSTEPAVDATAPASAPTGLQKTIADLNKMMEQTP